MKIDENTDNLPANGNSWLDIAVKVFIVVGTIEFLFGLVLLCVLQAQGKLPY